MSKLGFAVCKTSFLNAYSSTMPHAADPYFDIGVSLIGQLRVEYMVFNEEKEQ